MFPSGDHAQLLTQCVWPASAASLCALQRVGPRSQTATFSSMPAETRRWLSGENASERTPPGCATHSCTMCPAASQRMMVESQDPDAIRWLLGEMARQVVASSCPMAVAADHVSS